MTMTSYDKNITFLFSDVPRKQCQQEEKEDCKNVPRVQCQGLIHFQKLHKMKHYIFQINQEKSVE